MYRFLSIADPEMQLGSISYSGDLRAVTIVATNPARLLDSLCTTHTISQEIYTRILREFRELEINPNFSSDRETLETPIATENARSPLLSKV